MEGGGLVSIIIPVFNVRPYLAEAIDSVLKQTYRDLEIIIIDDGSTDGSSIICDDYKKKDERIRVVHQKNKGLSSARNVGLDLSTGDVIAFLDSDDVFQQDFVSILMSYMDDNRTDIAICKYTECYQSTQKEVRNNKIYPACEQGIYNRSSMLRALVDNTIDHHVWNKIFRRELWDDLRFSEGIVYEDSDIIFKVANKANIIGVVDKPLYIYRKRSGSITDCCSEKNITDWLKACIHIESIVESGIPDTFSENQLRRRRQSRIHGMIAYYVKISHERKNRKNHLREKLRKSIIDMGNDFGVEGYDYSIRMFYWMICHFPCLLNLVFPCYYRYQRFISSHSW